MGGRLKKTLFIVMNDATKSSEVITNIIVMDKKAFLIFVLYPNMLEDKYKS